MPCSVHPILATQKIISKRAAILRPCSRYARAPASKLRVIRALALPGGLFDGVPSRMLLAYRFRVAAQELHELRRHPDPIRLTLLAAFCPVREREIADSLTDLLITTVHRVEPRSSPDIGTKAEKRVAGKSALLFKLAAASIAKPDGSVRDAIFPTVGEQTLYDLVAEGEATGTVYRRHLQAVIHNPYRSHYRRMLPLLLDALEFRSNNQAHRPVLDALDIIVRHAGRKVIRRGGSGLGVGHNHRARAGWGCNIHSKLNRNAIGKRQAENLEDHGNENRSHVSVSPDIKASIRWERVSPSAAWHR